MFDQSLPLVIRGDRWKAFRSFCTLSLIAAVCFVGIGSGKSMLILLLAAATSALFALQSLVPFIRPPRLIVDRDGILWHGIRSWQVAWSDIQQCPSTFVETWMAKAELNQVAQH